jgi:hypothetical protein
VKINRLHDARWIQPESASTIFMGQTKVNTDELMVSIFSVTQLILGVFVVNLPKRFTTETRSSHKDTDNYANQDCRVD